MLINFVRVVKYYLSAMVLPKRQAIKLDYFSLT